MHKVSGIVSDCITEARLQNVQVTACSAEDKKLSTVTDEQGCFTFDKMENGEWSLRALIWGYCSSHWKLDLVAEQKDIHIKLWLEPVSNVFDEPVIKEKTMTAAEALKGFLSDPEPFRLRFYKVYKGDCIALRASDKTIMIFDTGEGGEKYFCRGEERKDALGFGLALQDAVGSFNSNKKNSELIVVISHVDRDHIGGLKEWIQLVLDTAKDWGEARQIAQGEIQEVWCNIPPVILALSDLTNISIITTSAQGTDHKRQITTADQSHTQWVSDYKQQRDKYRRTSNSNDDPEIVFAKFRDIEKAAKYIFGQHRDEAEEAESIECKPDQAYQELSKSLSDTFRSTESDFISKLFGKGGEDISIYLTGDHNTTVSMGTWDFSMEVISPLRSVNCYCHFYLSTEKGGHAINYITKFKLNPANPSQYVSDWRIHFKNIPINIIPLDNQVVPEDKAMVMATEAIDQCASVQEVVHYILNLLRKYEFTDGNNLWEKIAILEAYFGLTEADVWKEQIGLFNALAKLGIPVFGAAKFLKEGIIKWADWLDVDILAPSHERLEKFCDKWDDYKEKLKVKLPERYNFETMLFMAMTVPSDYKFSEDSSKCNLSSISLWVRDTVTATLALFTGDGMYGEIMAEATKKVQKMGNTQIKNIYLQIPHHGGIHNTDISDNSILPQTIFSAPSFENIVMFASGGESSIHDAKRKQGPRKVILEYFQQEDSGKTNKVIAINPAMSDEGEEVVSVDLYYDGTTKFWNP